MHSRFPRDFVDQTRFQAKAISTQYQGNVIVVMVAYALMSGIIALWAAQLPPMTAYALRKLDLVSDNHLSVSSIVSHENKGDRLSGFTFEDRWRGLGNLDPVRPSATVPDPCTRCGVETSFKIGLAAKLRREPQFKA